MNDISNQAPCTDSTTAAAAMTTKEEEEEEAPLPRPPLLATTSSQWFLSCSSVEGGDNDVDLAQHCEEADQADDDVDVFEKEQDADGGSVTTATTALADDHDDGSPLVGDHRGRSLSIRNSLRYMLFNNMNLLVPASLTAAVAEEDDDVDQLMNASITEPATAAAGSSTTPAPQPKPPQTHLLAGWSDQLIA